MLIVRLSTVVNKVWWISSVVLSFLIIKDKLQRYSLYSTMAILQQVQGYKNFIEFIQNLTTKDPVFILFSGSKLPNGQSWCSDCVEAEPFIKQSLKMAPKDSYFVYVEVGDRPCWKDQKCSFRTDTKTKLNVLPTFVKWGTQKRLEGDQCLSNELLEMLITDEDD